MDMSIEGSWPQPIGFRYLLFAAAFLTGALWCAIRYYYHRSLLRRVACGFAIIVAPLGYFILSAQLLQRALVAAFGPQVQGFTAEPPYGLTLVAWYLLSAPIAIRGRRAALISRLGRAARPG